MADVARVFGPIAERRSNILERLSLRPRSYALATVHRQQNVDDDEALAQAVSVLNRIAEAMPVLLPAHPRTGAQLHRTGLESSLAEGITLLEPLGYLDFGSLLRNASAVVTDSGGVQKEAYLAAVPCLTLRERTEWVETVEAGWNRLVGLDPAKAAAALEQLAGSTGADIPHPALYGDGHAAVRVADGGCELDRRRRRGSTQMIDSTALCAWGRGWPSRSVDEGRSACWRQARDRGRRNAPARRVIQACMVVGSII